jgi:hypothetical protein
MALHDTFGMLWNEIAVLIVLSRATQLCLLRNTSQNARSNSYARVDENMLSGMQLRTKTKEEGDNNV